MGWGRGFGFKDKFFKKGCILKYRNEDPRVNLKLLQDLRKLKKIVDFPKRKVFLAGEYT